MLVGLYRQTAMLEYILCFGDDIHFGRLFTMRSIYCHLNTFDSAQRLVPYARNGNAREVSETHHKGIACDVIENMIHQPYNSYPQWVEAELC